MKLDSVSFIEIPAYNCKKSIENYSRGSIWFAMMVQFTLSTESAHWDAFLSCFYRKTAHDSTKFREHKLQSYEIRFCKFEENRSIQFHEILPEKYLIGFHLARYCGDPVHIIGQNWLHEAFLFRFYQKAAHDSYKIWGIWTLELWG